MSAIQIASVSSDDNNELWLEYYTDNIRHRVKVGDVAGLHADYTRAIKANAEVAELNADLQEQLAALEEMKVPCVWSQQDDEGQSMWESSCGDLFFLESDTPKKNNMKFCCFCGHPIVEELYEPEPDEDE